MEERQNRSHGLLTTLEADQPRLSLLGVDDNVAMGEHDSLWGSGSSAGLEENSEVVRVWAFNLSNIHRHCVLDLVIPRVDTIGNRPAQLLALFSSCRDGQAKK